MSHVLRTSDNRLGYWWEGFLLLSLLLPSKYLDMLFAPEWYAPNPQCDSLGPLVFELEVTLLPWGVLAAIVSAVIVFGLVRRREPGAAVFEPMIEGKLKNLAVTVALSALILPLAFDVVWYVWEVVIPQTVSSDCRGTADLVTVYKHRPVLQPSPFVEVPLVLWLLHIRALLLSKRTA